jgi:hypothetical protein
MRETGDAEALIALFRREGFERIEPRILQPADAFVELSGEDIRRRMVVTQDADGTEWCLRPEYTIPVCRHYLAMGGREPAALSYCGPVFRLRHGETGEFTQGGIESIGRRDATAADAEVIGLALDGLAALGIAAPTVRVGDVGLLHAFLDALDLSPLARRRVMRAVASGRPLDIAADPDGAGLSEHAGLLAAIEGQAPQAARAFVEDVLAIAGIAPVGGRTPAEIAERFLARAGRHGAGAMPEEARAVLDRYLRVAAIRTRPRPPSGRSPPIPGSTSAGLSTCSRSGPASWRRAASTSRPSASRRISPATSTTTPASSSRPPPPRGTGRRSPAAGATTGCFATSAPRPRSPPSAAPSGSTASGPPPPGPPPRERPPRRRRALQGPLQENAAAFFARAGLGLSQPRGAREYRGTLQGMPDVEVLFLSAAETVTRLAGGGVHLGITGEDLVREALPDAGSAVELLAPLGFGGANVVVAVPQAWIDVRGVADLDEVAAEFRARHGQKLGWRPST